LRLLAAPSTPESARIEAVERAQAGESITHSAAREIVSEHKTSRPAPITRHKEPEAIETPAEDDQSAWQPQEPEPQPEEQPTALDYVFPQRQAYQPIQEPEAPTAPSSERTQQRNVLTSQESDEWYTPSWCLDLVKQVLGHIELDPASSERANETVQARRFYTETDNGLVQSWQAHTLFLNPPYNGDAAQWSRKLVEVYGHGTVSEAILLVFGKLGYRWFEELWDRYPVAFTRERISFISASDRTTSQAKHVSAFIYFGQQREKFRQVFSGVGRVIYPEEGRYHDMHD
jgi:phage N-6-adenine-methyltransferase